MRIVYFAHSVLNRGGDKMVLAHLAHLAAAGHEVAIRSNVVETLFPLHPAISLEKPLMRSKLGTLLCAFLERQEADMVLASIVPTAVLLALRNRGRVLHFAQDDNETAYRAPWLRFSLRVLYSLAFSVLALPTVAVSETLAESFRRKYAAECSVVVNGVDTAAFYPAPSAELAKEKGARRAILLLSRSDPRKGFDLGGEAVAELCRRVQDTVEVWTVGDEVSGAPFPCPHRHFGRVEEEALRTLMSSADLFLSPSRSEGFPLMVLEAFACRCPVVTTEAVTFAVDGDNALVSGVGDVTSLAGKMERLLSDDSLRRAVADGGYRFAQRHRLADACARFETIVAKRFARSEG